MKHFSFLAYSLLLLLLCTASLFASLEADASITVGDYTIFLNEVASVDPHGLYDEKMETQPTGYSLQATGPETAVACGFIIRSGEPGHYCYTVAEEKEDFLINYLSRSSAQYYFNWLEHSASTSTLNFNGCEVAACDEQLQSNRLIFHEEQSAAVTQKNSGGNKKGELEKIAAIIAGTSVVFGANELREETGERRGNEQQERRSSPPGDKSKGSPPDNNRRTDSLTDESGNEESEGDNAVRTFTVTFKKKVTTSSVLRGAQQLFGDQIEAVQPTKHTPTGLPVISSSSSSSSGNTIRPPTISLKQIKEALKENPAAGRFLIQDQGETSSIEVSHSWNPLRLVRSSEEDKNQNKKVATALRTALQHEYGSTIANGVSLLMNDTTDWSSSRIDQVIRVADEIAEPTKLLPSGEKMQPTEEDLQQFPGARVIDVDEIDASEPGQKIRRRVLKTNFRYPYIRIEEVVEATTGLVTDRQVVIANYLLVTLKEGDSSEDFYHQLKSIIPGLEIKIEKTISYGRSYRIYFRAIPLTIFSEVLAATKNLDVSSEASDISNYPLTYNPPKKHQYYFKQWNLHGPRGIDAETAWNLQQSLTASPIAMIDSGLNRHDNLDNNIWSDPALLNAGSVRSLSDERKCLHGFDALRTKDGTKDLSGHGTLCSGIVGAIHHKTPTPRIDFYNRLGVAGVARYASLIACKVSDLDGISLNDDIADSIRYASDKGAKILNYSIGPKLQNGKYPTENKMVLEALKDARDAGVIFVAAAGNYAHNNDHVKPYPASNGLANVITVAATDSKGRLISDSNYGSRTVHLAAPGEDIFSTGHSARDVYVKCRGTSAAAPHVTAVLASMTEEFPKASCEQLIERLLATTDKLPTLTGKCVSGGIVNFAHALRRDLSGPFGCLEVSQLNVGEEEFSQKAIASRDDAHQASIMAEFAKDHAMESKPRATDEITHPWEDALLKAGQAVEGWRKTVTAYQSGLQQASEDSRDWWTKEHAAAAAELAAWEARITEWTAQKNKPPQQCIVM